MPSYKAVYSGDYLKAEDIYGKRLLVTVDSVALKRIREGEDPVLIVSFVGKDRSLILNKTNAFSLGKLYGEDYDGWIGRAIILFTIDNAYQDKPGIRIDPPPHGTVGVGAEAPMRAAIQVPVTEPDDAQGFTASDDDVPF